MNPFPPEIESKIESLRLALARRDRPRVYLVSVPAGPEREEMLERLRGWSEEDEIPPLVELHLTATEQPAGRLRKALGEASAPTSLLLLGLDQHFAPEQATPAIEMLSFFHDELLKILHAPLVVVAAPETIRHLLAVAAVSERSFSVELTLPPPTGGAEELLAPPGLSASLEPGAGEVAHLEHTIEFMRRHGASNEDCAAILGRLGSALGQARDYERAIATLEEALELSRRVGHVLGEANSIQRMADIAIHRLQHERARALYEEALPLHRRAGNVLGEANCIQRLGDLASTQKDFAAAHARYEQALRLHRRIRNTLGEANCIQRLGDLAFMQKDLAAARARYEETMPMYRRLGDLLGEANTNRRLGDLAFVRSDRATARARYEQALRLYRRLGNPDSIRETEKALERLFVRN